MSSIDMHSRNVDKRPLLHKFLSEKNKTQTKKNEANPHESKVGFPVAIARGCQRATQK